MARERDVRSAIQAAMMASNAFDAVWLSGLPEDYGKGVSNLSAAAIEPVSTAFSAGWDNVPDGAVVFAAKLRVTLLARNPDPQLRDETVEQLLDFLCDAVNGQNLVPGFTVPQKAMVGPWLWQPAQAPERRIQATVNYLYMLTSGWDSFDTSE